MKKNKKITVKRGIFSYGIPLSITYSFILQLRTNDYELSSLLTFEFLLILIGSLLFMGVLGGYLWAKAMNYMHEKK